MTLPRAIVPGLRLTPITVRIDTGMVATAAQKRARYGMRTKRGSGGRSAGLLDVNLQEAAVEQLARCARGTPRVANRLVRRMRDFADAVMSQWQAFRAGIEGTISGLKRAFRLARCLYRGFTSFAASIGLAVFSHNLVVLAKSGGT